MAGEKALNDDLSILAQWQREDADGYAEGRRLVFEALLLRQGTAGSSTWDDWETKARAFVGRNVVDGLARSKEAQKRWEK